MATAPARRGHRFRPPAAAPASSIWSMATPKSRLHGRRGPLLSGRLERAQKSHPQLWSPLGVAERHRRQERLGAALQLRLWVGKRQTSQPKTVIRGGYGFFYDRFGLDQILQADRLNASANSPQKEAVIQNPTCYYPNGISCRPILPALRANRQHQQQNRRLPDRAQSARPNQSNRLPAASSASSPSPLPSPSPISTRSVSTSSSPAMPMHRKCPATIPPPPTSISTTLRPSSSRTSSSPTSTRAFGQKLSLFGFYTLSFANSDSGGVSTNPVELRRPQARLRTRRL